MAAEKTNPSKPNKSEFIRSQPAELSAGAVVEKAKAEGVAKKSAAAAPPRTSKAAFVRKFPKASPREIVAKAQAEGINIELDYVYNVRSSDKVAKPGTKAEATAAVPRMAVSAPRPIATASSGEDLLKAVAAEIGLGRAIEILTGERARVRALIGG
jgi:hypothetical protein